MDINIRFICLIPVVLRIGIDKMSVDPRILYNLHQEVINLERDQFQSVLNNYLVAYSNKNPNLALDLGGENKPVIFTRSPNASVSSSSNVEQEKILDEINKPKSPRNS
jgi:hypothetical protein